MSRRVLSLAIAVLAGATACKGSGGATPAHPLQVPNAVSGGTRGGGRPEAPSAERQHEADAAAAAKAAQKAEDEAAAKVEKAEALWARAQGNEQSRPGSAADDYQKIADDHKDSPHAEEARYREAVLRHEMGDWHNAERAVEEYLKDNPVNPHLAEVERILYESCVNIFDATRGIKGIFKSNKRGFDGLNLLVERFPEGSYADDALMALGDEYVKEKDYANASLEYRSVLLRFPDSEWSFQARLRLGDVYLARDQGANYHAGYVDLDPRGPTTPQYAAGRPIRSCVEAALEQYQAFLDRTEIDPPRCAEYAGEVAYAKDRVAECRARLAAKDRTASAYYAHRGEGEAAQIYEGYARNVESGRPWSDGVPAAPPRPAAPTAAPPSAPRPATPPPPAPPPSVRPAAPPAPPPPEPPAPPELPPDSSVPPPPPGLPPPTPVPPPTPGPAPTGPLPSGVAPTGTGGPLPPPRHIPGSS